MQLVKELTLKDEENYMFYIRAIIYLGNSLLDVENVNILILLE